MKKEITNNAVLMFRPNAKVKPIATEETTMLDVESGEILQQTKNIISKSGDEPPFIKLYYDVMMAACNLKGVKTEFVLQIARYINYSNDPKEPLIFDSNKRVREEIMRAMGWTTEDSFQKALNKCISGGLLAKTKYRGSYEVNPWMIAKGHWNNIKELQLGFDFINGKWIRYSKTENEEEEE